jgi:hypothetical protein
MACRFEQNRIYVSHVTRSTYFQRVGPRLNELKCPYRTVRAIHDGELFFPPKDQDPGVHHQRLRETYEILKH